MARVYGEGLLHSKCAEIGSLRDAYLKTMTPWVAEMADKEPWEAASWIEFLQAFRPSRRISENIIADVHHADEMNPLSVFLKHTLHH